MTGTPSDWDKGMQEQSRMLGAQLAALRAGPKSRYKRFRKLQYVCGGCGGILLEVMETSPYPVIVVRSVERPPETSTELAPDYGALTGREIYALHKARGPILRAGDTTFIPFTMEQLEGGIRPGARWEIRCVCRCRQWLAPSPWIARDLTDGKRERTIPTAERATE